MLKYASTQTKHLLLLALHAVYFLHGRVHHAAAVGDAIATCVAHQYSIVKELDSVFQKPRLSTRFGVLTPGF